MSTAHTPAPSTSRRSLSSPTYYGLLRLIQYPQADILETELTDGFQLMGDLQPGTNWYSRADQKYLQPRSPAEFVDHNHTRTQQKLLKPRVDDNYAFMLNEIAQEVRAGRMNGPFQHPQSWSTPAIAPHGYDLYLTKIHGLPWLPASSRSAQTARTRSAEEKIGDAAATTPPAPCTTNRSITLLITSRHLRYGHIAYTRATRCTFAGTTTTEHIANFP